MENKTFSDLYPSLEQPLDKDQISSKFPDMQAQDLRKYEYYEQSEIDYADASSVIGNRKTMEDTYKIAKIGNIDFFAVYDGHGGWQISVLLKHNFYKKFTSLLNIDFLDSGKIKREILEICLEVGKEIFEISDCFRVGSTAIFALRKERHIYIGNIGDSTCIIFDSEGTIVLKTKGHKASDQDEINRIEMRGGFVCMKRVNGMLAVSRSFGDNHLNVDKEKTYKGFDTVVTHQPTFYTYELPEKSGKTYHMVLGSDGLWDNCDFNNNEHSVFKFSQVVEAVLSETPRDASKKIVDLALRTYINDNITAVVVNL